MENCPNCGAQIVGGKCEYCGTIFADFTSIDCDTPVCMKIKHKGEIVNMMIFLEKIKIFSEYEEIEPIPFKVGEYWSFVNQRVRNKIEATFIQV